jgi:phage baseplate assembly protein gpV
MAQTSKVLTDIAIKRLSGKAHTSAQLSLAQEGKGSTVQTLGSTVFGEQVPNEPNNASSELYKIQSGSVGENGTVQLVDFELIPFGGAYQNTTDSDAGDLADQGETTNNTFHSYGLFLSASFQTSASLNNFDTLTGTPTTVGNTPFVDGFFMTGSNGRLQIVPEFASNVVAGVGANNPYTPVVIATDGSTISPDDAIDWYLDTFSGILFVQDPSMYGSIGSPNSGNDIPAKVRAFIYVGKFQDQANDDSVDIAFSGSDGGTFSITNTNTASFAGGDSGLTVFTGSNSNQILIGSSSDTVSFNHISASGDVVIQGNLTAQQYIVSSSVTHLTQSFSSGSTVFGDTNEDTHQFTGSIQILHTSSADQENNIGLEISGSGLLINNGEFGKLAMGQHNVGLELGNVLGPITGSGLIVSQSFLSEGTHHNMVKIGETELVDISGSVVNNSDAFLMNVRNKSLVISSSQLDKPVAEFSNGTHILYSGSVKAIEVKTGGTGGSVILKTDNVSLQPNDGDGLTIRAGAGTTDDGNFVLLSSANPSTTPRTFNSFNTSTIFTEFGGPLTASSAYVSGAAVISGSISGSDLLFASLSGNPTHEDGILAVVYNTGSGQFFFTGSYGAGGGSQAVIESASQGILFGTGSSTSNATGSSISLMETASFSASGDGLSVDESSGTIIYNISPNDVFDGITATASTGSFTASQALTASAVTVTDNENEAVDQAIIFAQPDTGNGVQLQSDGGHFTYNPSAGQIKIGDASNVITIDPDLISTDDSGQFDLINTNATTINFGGAATTLNIGASTGTASFAGNLVVQGTMTQLDVENLLVDDQFILLNSGSGTGDGGIIVQTSASNEYTGTALYYDDSESRWAITSASSVTHTDTSGTPHQFIVTVSQSNASPTGNPSDFGNDNDSRRGLMYIDTSDSDGDGNTIYIYA